MSAEKTSVHAAAASNVCLRHARSKSIFFFPSPIRAPTGPRRLPGSTQQIKHWTSICGLCVISTLGHFPSVQAGLSGGDACLFDHIRAAAPQMCHVFFTNGHTPRSLPTLSENDECGRKRSLLSSAIWTEEKTNKQTKRQTKAFSTIVISHNWDSHYLLQNKRVFICCDDCWRLRCGGIKRLSLGAERPWQCCTERTVLCWWPQPGLFFPHAGLGWTACLI